MTVPCQKLPQSLAEEMLQVVARALCARPGDNPAQRDSRTRQMVYSTMGFDPRDGLEYMLTTMVFGHFNLLLDSMFDVFQGQMDTMKARTKTTIVALDRSMLSFVREMRLARRRPAVWSAEDAAREAGAEAIPPAAATQADAPPVGSVALDMETHTPKTEATPGPAVTTAPMRAASPDTRVLAAGRAAGSTAGDAQTPPQPVTLARNASTLIPRGRPETAAPNLSDEGTLEEHVAAFQEAFAAAQVTLAEARAYDEEAARAKSASGD